MEMWRQATQELKISRVMLDSDDLSVDIKVDIGVKLRRDDIGHFKSEFKPSRLETGIY